MKKVLVAALMILILIPAVSQAAAVTFTGASGDLAATAKFDVVGGRLQVILTNTSTADVLNPAQVLTALFFSVAGNPTLTPFSALLNTGSVVWFGPDGGGNVGGEWEYLAGLASAPGGATAGISSSGFGLFGSPNFGGANLQGPAAVDGGQYGITSFGDNPAVGNAKVTGGEALIHYSVVFLLNGISAGFDPLTAISHVSFQYGTALTDTNIPPPPPPPVPEPGTMMLLGSGLVGLAGWGRTKFRK